MAIVLLNWNGLADTRNCLKSLAETRYEDYAAFVVDNGSKENEADALEREFGSAIRVVRSARNLGFSGGNNLAFETVLADRAFDYVVTLNNDTTVDPAWLGELVSAADSDRRPGMVAAKMRLMDRPNVLNSTGFYILRDGAAISRGRYERDRGQYDEALDIFGPSAGAALYRADLLRDVGTFDNDFFAYFEDVDLAWRARLAGWTATFAPQSLVYHKHSASTSAFSRFKLYHGERNRIWCAIKNFPLRHLVGAYPYSAAKYALMLRASTQGKGVGAGYVSNIGRSEIAATMARAQVDALKRMPAMWSKRRDIARRSRVERRTVESWFQTYSLPLSQIPYR